MPDSFGIPQITQYLTEMQLKIGHIDRERELIELAFHGDRGQWRLIIGVQQQGSTKKLMLVAPQLGVVTNKKRLECLEALMAINYRIALGKFGLDPEDGEVRLEESIPLADSSLTFEQFQLALGAIIQTATIYYELLPRIMYGNQSAQEAIRSCEQDFFQSEEKGEKPSEGPSELDVNDVLAEVARLLEKPEE